MSDRNEMHAEVVKQMRVDGVIANRDGTVAMGGNALLEFADRAEAAHRREIDKLNSVIQAQRSQFDSEIDRLRREKTPGNVAKLREAVELALSLLDLGEDVPSKAVKQEDIDFMKAALAEPVRQCDVGTAEDHFTRHDNWCANNNNECGSRYLDDCFKCMAKFLQKPLKESEAGTEELPQAKRISGNGAGETKGGEGQ